MQTSEKQLPISVRSILFMYVLDVKKRKELVERLSVLPDMYYKKFQEQINSFIEQEFLEPMLEIEIQNQIYKEKIRAAMAETEKEYQKFIGQHFLEKYNHLASLIESVVTAYEQMESVKESPEIQYMLAYISTRKDSNFQFFIKEYPYFEYDPNKTLHENKEIAKECVLTREFRRQARSKVPSVSEA